MTLRSSRIVAWVLAAYGQLRATTRSEDFVLPPRYLRLARRQWEQDKALNARYDAMYAELYSKHSLRRRNFINFGPGSFQHKFWCTADRLYEGNNWSQQRGHGYQMSIDLEWNLIENTTVDVPDGSIEIVYCSHLVEHGWNSNVSFFFAEVHRILRNGGVFRVTCPDAALGVRAVRRGDRFYFNGQNGRPTSFMFLRDTSLVTTKGNEFRVTLDEADDYLGGFEDVYDALDEASRRSDRELQDKLGAHVNWFTVPKLTEFLNEAGFERVYRTGYGQSIAPVLRDVRYFDKTDPHMTCYVDAVKTSG